MDKRMTFRFTNKGGNIHLLKIKAKEEQKISNLIFKIFLLFLISITISGIFCSNKKFQRSISQKEFNEEWNKFLKSFPPGKSSHELQEPFYFPNEEQEKDGIFLSAPFYLCADKYKNIYVSDKNNHCILKFNNKGGYLDRFGGGGQAPGRFLLPRYIEIDFNNKIYVYDTGNSRIQFFNSRNEYLNSFKIFKSYSKMAIGNQGFIYLSPLTHNLNESLIEVLDTEGRLVNSFGKRMKFKYTSRMHQRLFISINKKGEIFIAWRYFPIVRRYSYQGELLSEYNIDYRLLKKLSKPNYKAKIIGNKIKMAQVICSIRAKDNKFYLLLGYPRLEILEINLTGEITNIYWKDYPNILHLTDFLVHEDNITKSKIFYVLSNFPEPQIKVLINKEISVKEILGQK